MVKPDSFGHPFQYQKVENSHETHDMRDTNFTECSRKYLNDPAAIAQYNYSGTVRLITPNPSTQISYEGCKALCGTGNDWYPWPVIATTITTWTLPTIGTLLQAPFESNAFWRTVKAINRWVGSPISSLAFILWNIEISGKCAIFGLYPYGIFNLRL